MAKGQAGLFLIRARHFFKFATTALTAIGLLACHLFNPTLQAFCLSPASFALALVSHRINHALYWQMDILLSLISLCASRSSWINWMKMINPRASQNRFSCLFACQVQPFFYLGHTKILYIATVVRKRLK